MTLTLIGSHGTTNFTRHGWQLLLELALQYGWKPAGVVELDEQEHIGKPVKLLELSRKELEHYELPQDHPLAEAVKSLFFKPSAPALGSYLNCPRFQVLAHDAAGIANALECALPDIPGHDALEHKAATFSASPSERFIPIDTPVNAFEWFSGDNKGNLKKFIAFCRQGGFEIC